MRIKGRTAIVTGASSGIGEAVALNLARSGADVILVARNGKRLKDVAERIRAYGQHAHMAAVDVRNRQTCDQALARAEKELGRASIRVNAAGVGYWKLFLDLTEDEHRSIDALNCLSYDP